MSSCQIREELQYSILKRNGPIRQDAFTTETRIAVNLWSPTPTKHCTSELNFISLFLLYIFKEKNYLYSTYKWLKWVVLGLIILL